MSCAVLLCTALYATLRCAAVLACLAAEVAHFATDARRLEGWRLGAGSSATFDKTCGGERYGSWLGGAKIIVGFDPSMCVCAGNSGFQPRDLCRLKFLSLGY